MTRPPLIPFDPDKTTGPAMTQPNPDMLHEAAQVGFTVFKTESNIKCWALHGDGSFVLLLAQDDTAPFEDGPIDLLGTPDGEFTIAIYFEVPDQAAPYAQINVKNFRNALLYGRMVLTVRSTGASMWECRRVLFSTPLCTDERDDGIDTQDSLLNDFMNWRAAYEFPKLPVDALRAEFADGGFALLATPHLLPEQTAWLKRFIARWELVSAQGRA